MARTVLAAGKITRDGLVVALTATPNVDGDAIPAGSVALYVRNTGGASVTVTVQATAEQDGLNLEDLVVPVAAGARVLLGPFPGQTFAQPAGAVESGGDDKGKVYVNYSTPASIERQVVAL